MPKTTSAFPRESVGPNALAQSKVAITTASGAAFIFRGSVVGRKTTDGTYAIAGAANVAAPYYVAAQDVDSSTAAQSFSGRLGRFLFPNVGGFYTILKSGKEVNFTDPDGAMVLLQGTGTFLIGIEPKTNQIIVSLGEQLPSIA